jgi:hypothetical protein
MMLLLARCNFEGTRSLIQLAGKMQRLRAFVHVSTFFVSNFQPVNTPVHEEVHYPTLQLAGALQVAFGTKHTHGVHCQADQSLAMFSDHSSSGCSCHITITACSKPALLYFDVAGTVLPHLPAAVLPGKHLDSTIIMSAPPALLLLLPLPSGDPKHLTAGQLAQHLLSVDPATAAAETAKIMERLNFISTYAFR